MMKKMICTVCCIALLLAICSSAQLVPVEATEADSSGVIETDALFDDNTMVYVSGEKLEQIYNLLQDDSFNGKLGLKMEGLMIVKESITPLYTLDPLEYARTGDLNVKPMWNSGRKNEPDNGKGNIYKVKLITADGKYGGILTFRIEGGVAYQVSKLRSENIVDMTDEYNAKAFYEASPSYADHAERIARLLKEDEPILAQDVKLVRVAPGGGLFFYIKNENHHVLIAVGVTNSRLTGYFDQVENYCLDLDDPKTLEAAKQSLAAYEAQMAEIAEWKAAHPGEPYYGGIPSFDLHGETDGFGRVDNILDIAAFLREDEARWIKAENFRKYGIPSIIATASALVIAGGVVTCVMIKRRRRRLETEEPNTMP